MRDPDRRPGGTHFRPPPGVRPLADEWRTAVGSASACESDLDASFWTRNCGDAGGFWSAWRSAHASGTTRLACLAIYRRWLGAKAFSSPADDVSRLSAIVAANGRARQSRFR